MSNNLNILVLLSYVITYFIKTSKLLFTLDKICDLTSKNDWCFYYFSAFRIHISNYTYSELIVSGGYEFLERGTIPVKVSTGILL